jgi:hypothetical protein
VTLAGAKTFSGNVVASGNVTVSGNLSTTGPVGASQIFRLGYGSTSATTKYIQAYPLSDGSTATVQLTFSGGTSGSSNTGSFGINAASTSISGTLLAAGNTTIQGTLSLTGAATFSSSLSTTGIYTRAGSSASRGSNLYNFNWSSSSLVAWIDSSNVGTVTLSSSDYRIKDDLGALDISALDIINASTVKKWKFKDVGAWKADGVEHFGWIAHELQDVCANLVSGSKDSVDDDGNIVPQQLDLIGIAGTLWKGEQELYAMI